MPLEDIAPLDEVEETAEHSRLRDISLITHSVSALSSALVMCDHIQPEIVQQSTGLGGPGNFRKKLKRAATCSTKSEVEILAAMAKTNMSRASADDLLEVVTNVSAVSIVRHFNTVLCTNMIVAWFPWIDLGSINIQTFKGKVRKVI